MATKFRYVVQWRYVPGGRLYKSRKMPRRRAKYCAARMNELVPDVPHWIVIVM